MGPPIFIGGNWRGDVLLRERRRGFNGATDFHRWKLHGVVFAIKYTIGFNGATDFHRWKYEYLDPAVVALLASMGPPIFIGGNYAYRKIYPGASKASMGPPIFIGGNPSTRQTHPEMPRGFNGATDFHRWKCTSGAKLMIAPNVLQWGHRFSSVEMGSKLSRPPWRKRLQWGHRFSSVEIILLCHFRQLVQLASMGPPIFIGGN